MTETEWLNATDPQAMLAFLRTTGKLTDRKARLFKVAWCGKIWSHLTDSRSRRVVEIAERYAVGRASMADLKGACDSAGVPVDWGSVTLALTGKVLGGPCDLLRDLFGPTPFRPITLSPSLRTWNSGTLVRLATSIYEERVFERMPVLGDALEEAGCESEEVIEHCRGPGPHCLGCWVLDLVLGNA